MPLVHNASNTTDIADNAGSGNLAQDESAYAANVNDDAHSEVSEADHFVADTKLQDEIAKHIARIAKLEEALRQAEARAARERTQKEEAIEAAKRAAEARMTFLLEAAERRVVEERRIKELAQQDAHEARQREAREVAARVEAQQQLNHERAQSQTMVAGYNAHVESLKGAITSTQEAGRIHSESVGSEFQKKIDALHTEIKRLRG